jgi:hypothetical protein
MSQSEEITPDVYTQTIERCAAAYHRVRAELPQGATYFEDQENSHKAFLAFAAELPILRDPDSFQLYVACIGKGAAIDIVDIGRFCHIAQTAMAVWKLANLTISAFQAAERAAQEKAQKQATPLKGNQSQVPTSSQVGDALQYALAHLPMFEVHKQLPGT